MPNIDQATLRRANLYVDLFRRDTTNVNEAAIAARKFAIILSDNGLKPSELLRSAEIVAHLSKKSAEQLRECTARLRAAEAECAALRSEIAAAKAYRHKPTADSHQHSGPLSAGSKHDRAQMHGTKRKAPFKQAQKFSQTAISAAKRTHWRSAFAAAAGISLIQLRSILALEVIPQAYWELINKMTLEDWAPASRRRWTDSDRATLRRLATGSIGDVELARILTTHLGRRVLEGGVARQRRKLGIRACRV